MLEKLTKQFGKKGISFSKQGSLVLLEVENSHAKAKIYAYQHGTLKLVYTNSKLINSRLNYVL